MQNETRVLKIFFFLKCSHVFILVEKKRRLLQIRKIESLSGKGYKKINRLINWFLAELQLQQ